MTELILLVGTNPLPGLVVAKYLLARDDPPRRIHLAFSEENPAINQAGTLCFAEALRDQLGALPGLQPPGFRMVPLSNVSSVSTIERDLARFFPAGSPPPGGYHLNYTGGTKVMTAAFHGYFKRSFPGAPGPSYLDARTCRLVDDDGVFSPLPGDLRDCVEVDVESLLALHGYRTLRHESAVPGDLVAPTAVLSRLVAAGDIGAFLDWKNLFLRGIFYNASGALILAKSSFLEHLERAEVRRLVDDFPRRLSPAVREILNLLDPSIIENGNLWIPSAAATNREFKARIEYPVRFLDGRWLEAHLLQELKAALPGGYGLGANLEAARPGSRKFELDLFVIRGYQLTGIAATTDKSRYLCKSKGFEVLHRVRQAGGDESKAVLVTAQECAEAVDLEEDIRSISGSSAGHFRVFGLADWPGIGRKIDNFIRS